MVKQQPGVGFTFVMLIGLIVFSLSDLTMPLKLSHCFCQQHLSLLLVWTKSNDEARCNKHGTTCSAFFSMSDVKRCLIGV